MLRELLPVLVVVTGCSGSAVVVPGNAVVIVDTAVFDTSPFDTGLPGIPVAGPIALPVVPLPPLPPDSVPPTFRENEGDTDQDAQGLAPHDDPCPAPAVPYIPNGGPLGPCRGRPDSTPPPRP